MLCLDYSIGVVFNLRIRWVCDSSREGETCIFVDNTKPYNNFSFRCDQNFWVCLKFESQQNSSLPAYTVHKFLSFVDIQYRIMNN